MTMKPLWEQTVERIRQAGELWRQRGILPMLRQWLFWYQIPERLLGEVNGERQLTDALHWGIAANRRQYLNGEHALLRWLLNVASNRMAMRMSNNCGSISEHQRVQIVTIHKSKAGCNMVWCVAVYLPYRAMTHRVITPRTACDSIRPAPDEAWGASK